MRHTRRSTLLAAAAIAFFAACSGTTSLDPTTAGAQAEEDGIGQAANAGDDATGADDARSTGEDDTMAGDADEGESDDGQMAGADDGQSADDDTGSDAGDDAGDDMSGEGPSSSIAVFEVTIENLTSGQPMTPPLVVTHSAAADLFEVGSPASFGIKEIAENGNLTPLASDLPDLAPVSDVVIAASPGPGPLMPGSSISFRLEAEPGADLVSFVAMLICTNDGFTGLDSGALPTQVGGSVTMELNAYDAGTEINTESFEDLVPPCPVLTGVPSTAPGTGMSDPTIAEGGVIHAHPGIVGNASLDASIHGWTDPVARITIERAR